MPKRRAAKKREIVPRAVKHLLLDPDNPRLTSAVGRDQDKLLAWMLREEAIDEVALSIAEHGYFSEEPLVVVPAPDAPGMHIVVEGNRRLSALKLLLNPALAAKLGAADWPKLTAAQIADLAEVPTVEYATRDEVVPYLGFRHITGVKTWDPYAKARYIAQLIDAGSNVSDIEKGIGDSAGTVKKLYQALIVYNQAVNEADAPSKELRSRFSLLEVALGQQPIKKHLGLPRELPQQKTDKLIDEAHVPALQEVVSWIFGDASKGVRPVINDSRQIAQRLAPAIAERESLTLLRRTRDLEAAYDLSGGEREFLLKEIAAANRSAKKALGVAPQYKGDEEVVPEVGKLKKTVKSLEDVVR
jgi:ParB-like chromosome segregation protein Spo0J